MVLPAIFVVNAIAGTAIRFAAKKAAQSFVKKFGGKLVSNAGKRKILASTASGVKKFMDKFKFTKGGQKDFTKRLKKDDMIALTSKKKPPPSGKLVTSPKPSNIKPPVARPKPQRTSVGSARLRRIEKPRDMKNITPRKGSGTSVPRGGSGSGRTGSGSQLTGNRELFKTVMTILNTPKIKDEKPKEQVNTPPPKLFNKKLRAEDLPKPKPKRIDPPKSKPKRIDPPKPKPKTKQKDIPVDTKRRRTSPIKKPDLSKLTGKFGVNGFSRTGSTMSDFLIGFTDGDGGKGRNYDKFMAKDKNGQYKVKTDTLKSMAKRLKEKMKKKK